MASALSALARLTTRRPRSAAALIVVLLVAAIGLGTSAGGELADDFRVPGIESQQAEDLIAERFPGQEGDSATVVMRATEGSLRAPARERAIASALAAIGAQPHVTSVSPALAAGSLAADGRTAFAVVSYDREAGDLGAEPRRRLEAATADLPAAGVRVAMSGQVVNAGDEAEVPIGEIAGVIVAMLLLLLVLRSAGAALSSLLTAGLGVGVGFALLGLAARGIEIPTLAPTIAAMLGLGAGIDYALLNAARHQEELQAGREPGAAAVRANATAGHSALTAAAIVFISISGLLVTGIPFVGKVGVAAGAMVLVTALVAVLLLPPLFAALGRRMLPRRVRRRVAGGGAPPGPTRLGLAVRRPRLALVAGALIAVVLMLPATGLELGQPDDGNLPPDQTQRQAYDLLTAAFGPGFNGPLLVAVAAPRGADARPTVERLRREIARTADVASVAPPAFDAGEDAAILTVFPASSPQDERTSDLVHELRERAIPRAERDGTVAYVGGYTARIIDEAERIGSRLPLFALTVIGLSLVLLGLTFRSLKLAVLSAVLNLVSIAAAYGAIHLLFQTAGGTGLIEVEPQPVVPYTPLFMFAILFGLSTDYNVFLLSRVREEWLERGHVAAAVAQASARTRWTISAAGAIMIAVFLGFATDPDSTVKMTGFGLASAILIDITLVRLLLAPAAMTLLGDRLWGSAPAGPRRSGAGKPTG